ALDQYCVTCHNERLKTAGLMLDRLDVGNAAADADVWEKVIRKLRVGMMPPQGAPRPDRATQQALVSYLEDALDRAAAANPNPGQPLAHRLNRAEYTNAIRDLLDLDISGSALLPADNSSYGFDNIADVLTMSPGLLDRYVSAARKISRAAIGAPDINPDEVVYPISALAVQQDRASDALP